jgi:hypothetical protein
MDNFDCNFAAKSLALSSKIEDCPSPTRDRFLKEVVPTVIYFY